jgi:cysteine synthase A
MDAATKAGCAIAESILALVGNTPIVRLNRLPGADSAEVLAKLESMSPGGSVKDRVALALLERAEAEGLLDADTVVLEPSSGNTGIGLAMVCAARGYRCVIVMPDSMSLERIYILRRFGAEVVLTPAREGMAGAVRRVDELARAMTRVFLPRQFDNACNPEVHRRTTAREILAATGGRLDAFVAGVGTGGTITGVGGALKREVPGLRVVAVEPAASPVLSGGRPGEHNIQGIGAGFVPGVLDRTVIDDIRLVDDRAAFETMKQLAAREGILAGISAGAAVRVALDVARALGPGRRVLTVLPDTGERYLTVQQYFEF